MDNPTIKESKRRVKFGTQRGAAVSVSRQAHCVLHLSQAFSRIYGNMATAISFFSISMPGIPRRRGTKADWRAEESLTRVMMLAGVLALCTETGWAENTELPWGAVAEVIRVPNAGRDCPAGADANCPLVFAHAPQVPGSDPDYALRAGQMAILNLPEEWEIPVRLQEEKLECFRWQDSAWKVTTALMLQRQGRHVQWVCGSQDQGFFRMYAPSVNPAGKTSRACFHALVADDWKKDLLLFCRDNKRQVELNADPQLVRSSLAVSHWDHVMRLAAGSRMLTAGILRALAHAVEAQRAFESGEYPPLVVGLNQLRLKRFPGAITEQFVLFVPDHCDGSKTWPLVVHCDNGRFAAPERYLARTGYLDLWWHTVTDKDVDWKSYQAIRDVMSRFVPIDPDRVYVTGDCADALAAVSLALNYPDHWAECCVSLGNTYRHLAGNALNLPFILYRGGHQDPRYDPYLDFAIKCFEYHRCPYFKGSRTEDAPQLRGASQPQAVRERRPRHVSYTLESLHNPSAYWVTIAGREDENLLGNIEAQVDGQTVQITTHNVDAYTLDLNLAPLDANRPVQIVENGRGLGTATGPTFVRRSAKYAHAERVKTPLLSGPLWDVFTDAYAVVWGRGGANPELVTASEQVARSLAGQGICMADTDLSEQLLATSHLVLVGTPESNRWLAKVAPCLPVRAEPGRLQAGAMSYEGPDLAYMLVYPNPLDTAHYVAVYSATSAQAMSALPAAYALLKTLRPADVGIFEVRKDGRLKWHLFECFDTTWNWHEKYTRPAMTVQREHPSWQWQQWLASTLRQHLGADVLICDEPFLSEETVPVGQVTYRNVFNCFRNAWIIQVDISGADLRKMATTPFANPARQGNAGPVIDGVVLIKTDVRAGERVLAVSELESDRMYKAAMPERYMKGEPLGVVPQKYEITGQIWLVPTLVSWLEAHDRLDIDAELDRFTFRMF
jgi:hypothetical protein